MVCSMTVVTVICQLRKESEVVDNDSIEIHHQSGWSAEHYINMKLHSIQTDCRAET